MSASERVRPDSRQAYHRFFEMETRWNDVDMYGHMNNVVYLEYFDSALNKALIEAGALDLSGSGPIGLVAHNFTHYFTEVSYPERVAIGVRVNRIGNTSLTWGFGFFREHNEFAAAQGGYVHVYVDRQTRRPVPLTPALKAAAEAFFVPPGPDRKTT